MKKRIPSRSRVFFRLLGRGDWRKMCYLGGGNSNIFGIFTPKIGEMIQLDEHIFQRGWNHQLVIFLPCFFLWACVAEDLRNVLLWEDLIFTGLDLAMSNRRCRNSKAGSIVITSQIPVGFDPVSVYTWSWSFLSARETAFQTLKFLRTSTRMCQGLSLEHLGPALWGGTVD